MGEEEGGEGGEAGEQQIRAPSNPYFSFSSSSFSLCIRRGFDKKFRSRQRRTATDPRPPPLTTGLPDLFPIVVQLLTPLSQVIPHIHLVFIGGCLLLPPSLSRVC